MQIVSIKPSRIPNRVWITFSNNYFIPFFIDDVVKLSLKTNQEIDEANFRLITKTFLFFVGREYALRQIAISPKTEKIINQKLKLFFKKTSLKYKVNLDNLNLDKINKKIIKELKNKKLLNDLDFVEYFINKNKRKSHYQIIYLLKQFGVSSDILSSIDFDKEKDVEKIKIFLNKKNIDKSKLTDYNEKNKIKASLFRRGFNISDINTAIDDWLNFR
jgi:SOS response regulatory protein OraA/RecX